MRTLIYGPFKVSFEYRDDSVLNLERIWPKHADEYALYLEIIMEDKEML